MKLAGRVNLDKLRADAPQLWAEATARYKGGEKWWFDEHDPRDMRVAATAEREQRRRIGVGYWDELAATLADKLVCGKLTDEENGCDALDTGWFSGPTVRLWLAQVGAKSVDDTAWLRATEGLRRAGWESRKASTIRWRLSDERRDELRKFFDVEPRPKPSKSLKQAAAEIAAAETAARAIEAAKGVLHE